MNKLSYIKAELRRLSHPELLQIRDFLDDLIENGSELTPEFEAKIHRSEREMAAGLYSRLRQTPVPPNAQCVCRECD